MFILVVGAGRVGSTVAKWALAEGHEVSVLDEDPLSHERLDQDASWEDAGGRFTVGTGLEMDALVEAGIEEEPDVVIATRDGDNTDLVIAVTGDDEDNILICQVAKEKYMCERIVARVNNPRNLQHFKLLGIQPAVSATDLILRLIEHEVPQYGLVHLLDLAEDRLEIIELIVDGSSPVAGTRVNDVEMPDGSLIISALREGGGVVPQGDTVIEAGDEVLVVLDPGLEDDITTRFAPDGRRPDG